MSDETRPDADGESGRFLRRLTRLAIAIAVVVPAVAAGLLAAWVFDEGSPNLDDLDYRNQAAALAQGHLTLSTSHLPVFAPYLSGVFDGRVVFSHQPVWPAVMAVGQIVHLPNPVLLAMTTAAAIAAFAFLVHELTGSTRITAASALVLGFSPIVVVQGATLLPYTLQFALMCAGAAWVLRAQRTVSRRAGISGGIAIGVAIFNRPVDALLVLVPLALYLVWITRRKQLLALARWVAVGIAGPLVLLLAYNWMVMGNPLRFPYTVHPTDTFGFGPRSSYVSGPAPLTEYNVGDAFTGLGRNLAEVPRFFAGGFVGLVLASIGLFSFRKQRWTALVTVVAVAMPLGYFFWWTSWNTTNFGLHSLLGPAYYYSSFAALALLAGAGWVALARRVPAVAVTLLVAVVGVTTVSFSAIVRQDQDATDGIKTLTKMLDSVTAPRRLVLLPPSYPFDPYVRQFNEPDLNDDVLYGLDVGPPTLDVALADVDHSLYRLHYEKPYGGLFSQGAAPVLEPLTVRRGRSIVVTAMFHRPPDVVGEVTPYLQSDAGFADPATVSSADPDTVIATWVLGASPGATSDGVVVDDPMTVAVGFAVGGPVTDAQRFESRVVVGPDGQGGVALLEPGVSYRQYVFPGNKRAWSQENLTRPIDVRYAEQP